MTSSLRRRRNGSPSRGRNTTADDQTAVLSRLLSVAAAATALSLIGDNERIHGNDGDESSFNGFLRSLESGRLASTLRQGQGGNDDEDEGSDGQEGVNAPLNFFRMFRFGSSNNQQQSNHSNNSNNNSTSPNTTDAGGANNDVRMIPIIIVGIRSITPSAGGNPPDGDTAIPPFLDPLANFPSPITGQGDGSGAPGLDGFGGIPQPRNGTRFSHMRRRRASMGGLNAGLSGYDSQRHQRSSEGNGRPWSTISDGGAASSRPPSEPFPSLASSRAPTPLAQNRPSSTTTTTTTAPTTPTTITPTLSASQPSRSSEHSVAAPSPTAITGGSGLAPTVEEDWNPQPASLSPSLRSTRRPFQAPHRRLSDPASRFRIPRFGSGSSRRNAIIEPDPPRGVGAGIGAARSWIIYVLGGSYPENHPILTTPSLFSDSPTYEDMVLLGSLLGPAKAPVARREDVDAAGGLVTIMRDTDGGGLVDGEVEGRTIVLRLSAEQQCLVCLEEFVAGELGRKLNRCGHLFHRDCIDHWLTTGRNSCPLCRGQGVDEVPPPPYPVDGTQSGFGSASGVPRGGRGEAEAEAEGEI
ncbi:hypothetical protein BDY21DRAFT_289983 [Lineolata rhizophorae]|uniref:RING-type domain-containing protein n=1 Tax=Lineolata rhizophorae TaxID=578093 RepID=A0A6A6NUR7_9PEZI|nr:hypothetical protein BDY21DRAFT_289983 [Lineolata rhizophorae]